LVGYDLPDGTKIPPGHRIAIDMKAIHFDPATYPDPERCDLFRFAKLRDLEGTDSKYGFATIDSHVCPSDHAFIDRFLTSPALVFTLWCWYLTDYSTTILQNAHFCNSGRHACAGRFFAAVSHTTPGSLAKNRVTPLMSLFSTLQTVLKIMLAHILLNYDIKLPPGITKRPVNINFNGAIIPDTKAEMVFVPRA
jgi:hypothetical protein